MFFLIVLVLGVLFLVVRYSKITETNHKKILYTYLIAWAIVLLMSYAGLHDMETPSNFAYFLFLLHLVGFIAGALIIKTAYNNKSKISFYSSDIIENNIIRILNSPVFRIIIILMSIYVTYIFSKYWVKVLFYNNISETRDQLVEIYGSFYYTFARPLLFLPTTIMCYVLFGYSILKKRDWVCFLMGYYLLVNSSLAGGRIGYVFIALGVVFVNIFVVKAKLRNNWMKLSLATAALYGIIVLITIFRMSSLSVEKTDLEYGIETTNEQFVKYLVGPQSAFDYALNNNYLSQVGGYGYGEFTFTPVVNLMDLIISIPTSIRLNGHVMKLITQLEDTKIYLGGGDQGWNALYTSVIFYYMDAGIIGVFIFPFIIGLLSSLLIKKMLKSGSVILFALSCFFFICMIKSVMKMEILWGYDTFAIVVMLYIGLNVKRHGIKQLR